MTYVSVCSLLLLIAAACTPASQAGADLTGYPWLYQLEGVAPGPESVEVIFVGDVLLGRGVLSDEDPLGQVSPWLRIADLAVGNLEGVLTEAADAGGSTSRNPIKLSMPARASQDLAAAGFDLLGLANNHSLDYGEVGLRQTADQLAVSGIATVGAGADQNQAWTPSYFHIRDVTLAFLAVNAVPVPGDRPSGWVVARWDPELAARAVQEAAGRADAVVVLIHWGYEYQPRVDPAQEKIADLMAEAGADLVVGHHPHVVQGTRITPEGSFVAYSLGNFVFDQFEENTREGLALRVFFDEGGVAAVQALPVHAGPRPVLMDMETVGPVLARLEPETWRVGFRRAGEIWEPADPPASQQSGVFVSGAIDLTGDGAPERIRLDRGGVVIEGEGGPTWESPPEWEVLDVTLGDPNDDGRYEALLVMNKPAADGEFRSHFFIIGYRGGIYQTVWGGSAVGDPILEAELANVDDDPAQELLVLEVVGEAGETAISIWDWHGWGFSRAWRSPEGWYRDLQVEEAVGFVISVEVIR